MSLGNIFATLVRVVRQLLHDSRTLVLLFLIPSILLTIMKFVFDKNDALFNSIAPMLLGIFPMVMMFLVTSIVTLRERSSGTLDRLLTTPLTKVEFIFGYALAFLLLALIQALITTVFMLTVLNVDVAGSFVATISAAIASAFLGTSLGLFLSAFATSEFQAIQFMPAFIFPQFLLCGLLTPRELMSKPLQYVSDVMPLTYSVEAMQEITKNNMWSGTLTKDIVIVASVGIVALILGSITIKRSE